MVKINGSSFPHQYRRTNPFPIDSTETWNTLEDATAYARNTDKEAYMPYSGQVISIEGKDDLYVLVEDETISKADGRNHFKLHKVSTEEDSSEKYLSKVVEDRAKKLIHFDEGIDVKGGVKTDTVTATEGITGKNITATDTVKGNNVQAIDTVSGKNATISVKTTTLNLLVQALADIYDLSVSHVATLMGTIVKDYISSESYVSGMSGNGMKIYKALNGDWNMELDNLTIRKIFTVFELLVQKIVHQGGMVIRSAAGGKLTKVTDGGTYWKCEYDSTDDFLKDDQIVCQAFTGTAIKRYWRLVTSAGAGYFNLSKSDCETGSGTPEAGDDVSVLGNRTNTARQKAQIDCAVGDTAPYRDDYAGINSYSLAGKLITRTGELSGITDAAFGVLSGSGLYATNVYLKGMFILRSGKSVESELNAVNAAVIEAQRDADAAAGAASNAKTTANNAKTSADGANGLLSDIASDSKLTPTEKQQTKKEWDVIVSEKPMNNASAVKFGVATTSYDAAYNTLNTYITPLLASLTTTSDIVGTTFRNTFKVYYDTRTNLLNAISAAAKVLADNAQASVDNLQVGGRNLLLDSKLSLSGTSYNISFWNCVRDFTVGEELTVTVKGNTSGTKLFGIWFNSDKIESGSLLKVEDGIYSKTIKVPAGTTNRRIGLFLRGNSPATDSWSFEWIKLETGNRRTDWTPAPEDLDAKITTIETNFEIREGQISSKITEVTKKVTEATTSATNAKTSETNASNSATTAGQKATAAGTSATNAAKSATDAQTASNSAGKVLEEVSKKESSINQTAGQISTNVTEVTKKVTEANTAASNAGSSATAAAGSATNAGNSATAASGSAGTATTKAGEASTSATNASKSATSAAGSATTASTKAGEASTSAGNAKKSADDAAAKLVTITEKESSINQTASGITLQVKEVTTKASEATTSATNAGNSASTASSKATAAGNSATAAAGSAGTASTKAGEAATSASTATTKANAASGSATAAATSATNAKNSADASAVVLQTVSTKQSEINAKADQITLKVTEVTEKTVQATNAAELATAMSKGKMLYRDPSFTNGMNGVSAYNNSGGGTVTVTRVSGVAGNPNGSGYCLKIMTTGASSPGWGGFLQAPTVKANQCLVYRLIANIPVGRTLSYARNDAGNGVSEKWLTSKSGTGNWEEYVYVLHCGVTGTFSGCGHFYLTGGATPTASAPLIWYVSYATVFDVTDAEVDYIADAAGKYTTKTTYEAGIKVLSDSITSKVSQTDFNSLGTRVGNAESTISQHTTQIASKVAQTTFDALGKRVSSAETTITQHTSQISLKAAQTDVTALGTRMSSAEAKITSDAIKLTVKSQTETIAAEAAKRTEVLVDAMGLDANKYYPVTMILYTSVDYYTISVGRDLSISYGKPSWSTHTNGFSVLCRWTTNACGWGAREIKRTILDYSYGFASAAPVGSIGQLTNWSEEYVYVRGGSKYRVVVEGATGVSITLRTTGYTHSDGTYTQSAPILTAITEPVPDLQQRPTTETIKSQITLDGFGISVFGKKIDFTGKVTFSSMDSATQSTINGKATTGYVDTAKSSAISTAASDAQSKADAAKNAAISSAASDAQAKANTAKNDAISSAATDATTKANNAKSAAITAAATDAQTKANTAKNDAITAAAKDATTKADSAKSGAISTAAADASSKADSAKNAAISAAASDATTKANNALSTSRNDVAVKLGYTSYSDMEAKATASQTIINGGYIRTSLIQANTITADKIATGTITADKLNIGNVQAQILTADAIQALDITTGKLKVTTGATIGGFKVDGINMCNRDNQECWISIDRTVGSTRRISSLGNNIPTTAGIDLAGYFSATGPNENRALVLNASGSNDYEWSGGKTNLAIDAVGGCKWKMKEGDHWSMPGVLWAGRVSFTGSVYSIAYQWGNGLELTGFRRSSAGFYVFGHNLNHSNYFVFASPIFHNAGNGWAFSAKAESIQPTSFTILVANSAGNGVDSWFSVMVVGGNF